jgi:hypothetical protein
MTRDDSFGLFGPFAIFRLAAMETVMFVRRTIRISGPASA